ncbi:hypothetical protein CR513_31723, partial [Mucuna pruriens]
LFAWTCALEDIRKKSKVQKVLDDVKKVKSIIKKKQALRNRVDSEKFYKSSGERRNYNLPSDFKTIDIIKVFEPITKVLKLVVGDEKSIMDFVYEVIGRDKQVIISILNFNLELCMEVIQTISNYERNWSTFNYIHTNARNKLKLQKLVFKFYNLKLKMRHIMRKSREEFEDNFNPFNLDYIFQDEDFLSLWLEENEGHKTCNDSLLILIMIIKKWLVEMIQI